MTEEIGSFVLGSLSETGVVGLFNKIVFDFMVRDSLDFSNIRHIQDIIQQQRNTNNQIHTLHHSTKNITISTSLSI